MIPVLKNLLSSIANTVPMSLIRTTHRPVLNYHACFDIVPPNVAHIDNVHPDWLYQHLKELKRYFTFLSIDEFAESRSRAPVTSLTFDDGYRCVLEFALPICADLGIPLTVFVNTSSLRHKTFWRHKVVFVIENNLVRECERSFKQIKKVPGLDFYSYLKHPVNSSITVEAEIDAFFRERGLHLQPAANIITDRSQLVTHPLISYGNHSHNHYVLSSLTFGQQLDEIQRGKDELESIPGIRISKVFSPPFGQSVHTNRDTLNIARDLGYTAVVLNRGYLNRPMPARATSIPVIERLSPPEVPIPGRVRREWIRSFTPVALRNAKSAMPSSGTAPCPPVWTPEMSWFPPGPDPKERHISRLVHHGSPPEDSLIAKE